MAQKYGLDDSLPIRDEVLGTLLRFDLKGGVDGGLTFLLDGVVSVSDPYWSLGKSAIFRSTDHVFYDSCLNGEGVRIVAVGYLRNQG